MGFQFNGLKAAVTISGSVAVGYPSPTSSQTTIMKTSGKTGVAVTAGTGTSLYTVTNGKTLYITSLSLGNSSTVYLLRDGTIAGTAIYAHYSQGAGATDNCTVTQQFPTPLKFSSAVFLDTANNATVVWSFSGWEE